MKMKRQRIYALPFLLNRPEITENKEGLITTMSNTIIASLI